MHNKWNENEKLYAALKADWDEEKEKVTAENWEKLAVKIVEAGRGASKKGPQLSLEEEKEQYYINCCNYLLLT